MKWSLGLPQAFHGTSTPSLSLQSVSGMPNMPGSELVMGFSWGLGEESSRWSPDV